MILFCISGSGAGKTAAVILSFVNQGPLYVKALMSIAKKIAHGYGEKRIQEEVENIMDKKLNRPPKEEKLVHKIKFGLYKRVFFIMTT